MTIKWPDKYVIAIYFLLFAVGFLLFSYVMYGENLITWNNILHWDADLYYFVSLAGYHKAYVAFFPLFPYTWRWTGLDVYGICIFNLLCYGAGMLLLSRIFQFSRKQLLLYLSFPSAFFLFMPYAEAIFFLVCSVLLYALEKQRFSLFYILLFVAGFCRPTASVFLPALSILFAYKYLVKEYKLGLFFLHAGLSMLLCLLSFWMVMVFQYRQTGEWMSFFYYQDVSWGNRLSWPVLPFRTWNNDMRVLLLDGAALFLTFCSAALLIFYAFRYFFKRKIPVLRDAEMFSLLYLAGAGLIVVFFRCGSLFSINRFIFCTAFFSVGVSYLLQIFTPCPMKKTSMLALVIFLFTLLFGSYTHIQLALPFLAFTIYLSLWSFIPRHDLLGKVAFFGLFAGHVYFQFQLFAFFLQGHWVA